MKPLAAEKLAYADVSGCLPPLQLAHVTLRFFLCFCAVVCCAVIMWCWYGVVWCGEMGCDVG